MSAERKASRLRQSALLSEMVESPAQVSEFLDGVFRYGTLWVYLILFVACFVENLLPPFPGDSFIAAAGGLVALQRLDFLLTMSLILLGGVSSVMVLFYVGKGYGRDYFERKNFKYFSVKDIALMEKRLDKLGPLILVVSRFLVGIRTAVAIAAGVGRYPALKMLFYSTVSYILFTFLLMYLAIGAVENLGILKEYFERYNMIIWSLMTVTVITYFVGKYFLVKREGE